MAKGIYVGVASGVIVEEDLVEFTSNILPTDWSNSNSTSAMCTNDYGDWIVTATGTKSGYWASDAFDGNGDSYWKSNDLEVSSSSFAVLTIQCPTGIQIQPTSIYIKSQYCGLSGNPNNVVQGYNVATQAWESIRSFYSDYNVKETTLPVSNGQWYSAFRVQVQAYSTLYYNPYVYEFQIRSGTLKATSGVARKATKAYVGVDGVARKVKKGYIGVDGVARLFYSSETLIPFTSNIFPTSWTDDSDYQGASATNEYGTWSIGVGSIYTANTTNRASNAVDTSTTSYYRSGSMSSASSSAHLTISLSGGNTINPTKFTIRHAYTGNASYPPIIQGYSPEDNAWFELGTLTVTGSTAKTETINVSTDKFFSIFNVTVHRYNSSNKNAYIYDFKCTAGTIKPKE